MPQVLLTDLPTEVILLILEDPSLDLKDLLSVTLACKQFSSVAERQLYKLDASRKGDWWLPKGSRSVVWAARRNKPTILRKALDHGCDPNACEVVEPFQPWQPPGDDYDLPPSGPVSASALHYAVKGVFLDVLAMLLDARADTSALSRRFCGCGVYSDFENRDSRRRVKSPHHDVLHIAICSGHVSCVKLLLSRGVSALNPCSFVDARHTTSIPASILKKPALWPIHTAAATGNLEIIDLLAERHPDHPGIAGRLDQWGFSPLHYACQRWDCRATITNLVSYGAFGVRTNADGGGGGGGGGGDPAGPFSAVVLSDACSMGNIPAAEALLDCGAALPPNGDLLHDLATTTLHFQHEIDSRPGVLESLVARLCAAGLDVNFRPGNPNLEIRHTPLSAAIACREGRPERPFAFQARITRCLLAAGADPNCVVSMPGFMHQTPAAHIVKRLVEHGDAAHHSPYEPPSVYSFGPDRRVVNGLTAILVVLVEHGAKMHIKLGDMKESPWETFFRPNLYMPTADHLSPFLEKAASVLTAEPDEARELVTQALCVEYKGSRDKILGKLLRHGFPAPDPAADQDLCERLEAAMFRHKHYDIARFCIAHGAFKAPGDDIMRRALDGDHLWLAELVAQSGSPRFNLDCVKADTGETAMHLAARSRNGLLLQGLVDNGASPNVLDRSLATPLSVHLSAQCRSRETDEDWSRDDKIISRGSVPDLVMLTLNGMFTCGADPFILLNNEAEAGNALASTSTTTNSPCQPTPVMPLALMPLASCGRLSKTVSPFDHAISTGMPAFIKLSALTRPHQRLPPPPPGVCSYLHRAVAEQRWNLIDELVRVGADPNGSSQCQDRPLAQVLREMRREKERLQMYQGQQQGQLAEQQQQQKQSGSTGSFSGIFSGTFSSPSSTGFSGGFSGAARPVPVSYPGHGPGPSFLSRRVSGNKLKRMESAARALVACGGRSRGGATAEEDEAEIWRIVGGGL